MENVTCILCDKEISVLSSVQDCETERPICPSCVDKEFQLANVNKA